MNKIDNKKSFRFGLTSAVCLVIANMIGAGIFTTSGFSLAAIGNRQWVMYAWCVGGLIAVCGAISYGKLSRLITESGGEYLYLSRMLHPAIGFIAGWVSMIAGFSAAIALAALAFESYTLDFFVSKTTEPEPNLPVWYFSGSIAIGLIIVFGIIHSMQVRAGLWTQNVIIAFKLVLLVVFIAVAAASWHEGWKGIRESEPGSTFSIYVIASQLVWISLSFSGFNCAVYVAGEIRDPKHNVFWSMVIGTAIVTVLYLCLNYIFLFAPSYDSVVGQERIATIAATSLGGSRFALFVGLIILVALCSSVSSMIVAGPRVYAQMANDGVFPKLFKGTERGGVFTPANAVWLQVGLSLVFAVYLDLLDLIKYLGFTLSVSAALTVCCLFITQKNGRQFRLWSIVAPSVYVFATLALATIAAVNDYRILIAFAATIISGLALYFIFAKTDQLPPKVKD